MGELWEHVERLQREHVKEVVKNRLLEEQRQLEEELEFDRERESQMEFQRRQSQIDRNIEKQRRAAEQTEAELVHCKSKNKCNKGFVSLSSNKTNCTRLSNPSQIGPRLLLHLLPYRKIVLPPLFTTILASKTVLAYYQSNSHSCHIYHRNSLSLSNRGTTSRRAGCYQVQSSTETLENGDGNLEGPCVQRNHRRSEIRRLGDRSG